MPPTRGLSEKGASAPGHRRQSTLLARLDLARLVGLCLHTRPVVPESVQSVNGLVFGPLIDFSCSGGYIAGSGSAEASRTRCRRCQDCRLTHEEPALNRP